MKLHELSDSPEDALANRLEEFEGQFEYPLGQGRSFRISHGRDYTRFFRSMGASRVFVCEGSNRVVGALSIAIRTLTRPDGTTAMAAYIGDLKVAPAVRHSRALLRLAQAADAWARPQVTAAYGVVMNGTGATPANYSGRAGIESFESVGKIAILRLPAAEQATSSIESVAAKVGTACFARLTRGHNVPSGGCAEQRSEIAPRWFVAANGLACGRFEDTRRAKRLIANDGGEMISAHLACFAFSDPASAAGIIHAAQHYAFSMGLPAIFAAVPEARWEEVSNAIGSVDCLIAPATIYGAGLEPGVEWNINTSEI